MIRMETRSKIGILKYVANNGAKGVQFEGENFKWFNPVDDKAREMVHPDMVGKEVEIMLAENDNEFSSIVLLEGSKEEVPQTPPEEPEVEKALDKTENSVIEKKYPPGYNIIPVHRDPSIIDLTRENKNISECEHVTQFEVATLRKTKLVTTKKGGMNLTYASWAEVWGSLKELYPEAEFTVYENKNGMPYFSDKTGGFVKVGVNIKGLEHISHLPIMDHKNQAVTEDKLDTFIINKSIQRALVKACALHGLGLYVYQGEDYPEEEKK